VLVPVVVRDSHGREVGNLKKEDFRIFDRGKLRTISGFSVQERGLPQALTGPGGPPSTSSKEYARGTPPGGMPAQPSVPSQRFVIFLFDDLHLSVSDLAQVEKAVTGMLGNSLSATDYADVLSFSGKSSGLTRDRAKLQDAISKLRARQLYLHTSDECPDIDFYLADLILNMHNETAFQSAVEDTMACAHLQSNMRKIAENMVSAAASQALSLGDQDIRVTLGFVKEIVGKMSTLPGQRLLILVSPGFLSVTPEAMSLKSQIVDAAAQANVTISALDARGLYTTGMDASQQGGHSTFSLLTGRSSQHKRDSQEFQEDVLAELADGTGGTFVHNTNDLEGGLRRLADAPEYLYLLELPLQGIKPDGTYHLLKVKLNRDGLKLQARRGYFAPKPANRKN
jgi:VWFA-related protein